MKNDHITTAKILLWLAVFLIAGCSSSDRSSASQSTPTPASKPTSSVAATSTLMPLPGRIAFITGKAPNHRLKVMNANGNELTDITPSEFRNIMSLSWSPDGQYIAFTARKDDAMQIFKIKPDGSDLVQLTSSKQGGSDPSWSPDGKRIMFTSASEEDILDFNGDHIYQIYIMNSDGTEARRLVVKTKSDNISMIGSYRADGSVAVSEPVTRYASANYIVDLTGEIQKQFPEIVMPEIIAWSPDGKWIAHSPDPRFSECWGIEIMKFDQSESRCFLKQKAESLIYFGGITWSPDGKYILFSSNLNGDWDLYFIKNDGSQLKRLTKTPEQEGWAVWSATAQK